MILNQANFDRCNTAYSCLSTLVHVERSQPGHVTSNSNLLRSMVSICISNSVFIDELFSFLRKSPDLGRFTPGPGPGCESIGL